MTDFTQVSDNDLFSGMQEQPGSQNAYDRDIEIRRRQFETEQRVASAQIEAARATALTAKWTMLSAIAIALTVVVTGAGVWLDAFSR